MIRPSHLLITLAAFTVASPALAQAPSKELQKDADAFFEAGKRLSASGNYADACGKFEASQRLDPALATRCNIAIACHQMAGNKETAWALLQAVQREAHATGKPRSEQCALDALNALEPELTLLFLDVRAVASTPGLAVSLDGKPLGADAWDQRTAIQPGDHLVTASAPGRKPFTTTVTVPAKNKARITLPALEEAPQAPPTTLAPAPPPVPLPLPPPPDGKGRWTRLHTSAVVVGAVGVAGLAAGAIAGAVSLVDHQASMRGGACTTTAPFVCSGSDALGNASAAYTAGNVSTAAFAVGGAALAGAVVLWIVAPSRAPDRTAAASASVRVGPGGLSLGGVW